jgi:tetratricopeptide (TPR) repeat protein
MKDTLLNLRFFFRVAVLTVVGTFVLPACAARPQTARSELEGAPGAFTFSGGLTTHVDMFERAAHLLSEGDDVGAESIYRRLVDLEPANPSAYIGLGSSRFFQDQFVEARQAYTYVSDLDGDSAEAHVGLGSVAWRKGDVDEAMNEYSRALDIDESSAEAHWGMAVALEAQGHSARAISHLERVLELAPGSTLAGLAQPKLNDLRASSNPWQSASRYKPQAAAREVSSSRLLLPADDSLFIACCLLLIAGC